jgi:hypothetical protein
MPVEFADEQAPSMTNKHAARIDIEILLREND